MKRHAEHAVVSRHAWLQKHPSPQASGGEFHWYPEGGDRELRAGFVERMRGVEAPAVLWRIEGGRVAWGQVFSAVAPMDGRRYVGLVLSVVEAERPAAELLRTLSPPPPGPWRDGRCTASRECCSSREEPAASRSAMRGDVAGVARALLSGGAARVDDPTSPQLAGWVASIERMLPDAGGKARCGVWTTAGASGAGDRVAELVAAAWRHPGARAATAWKLLCELARARGESVDRLGAALAAIDVGAALTAEERAAVPGCESTVGVLHAWGRGRLDGSPGAATLAARLADLVALRVLVRLAAGDDPAGAIAEARWYALLPAARREDLLSAVAQRTTSLRAIVREAMEGTDA